MSRISENTHGALKIRAGILVQEPSHPAQQDQLCPAWGHCCCCLSHQLPPLGHSPCPSPRAVGAPPDQIPLGTQWKFNQEKVQGTTSPGCSKAKGRRTPKLEEQQGRE